MVCLACSTCYFLQFLCKKFVEDAPCLSAGELENLLWRERELLFLSKCYVKALPPVSLISQAFHLSS